MSIKSLSTIRTKLDPEVKCKLALRRFDIHDEHVRILDMGNHPDSDSGRRVHVHRFVWRYFNPDDVITSDEIIHHLNGDPLDNRVCNLTKVKREDHRRIHNKMEAYERGYKTFVRGVIRETEQEVIESMKCYAMV